MENLHRDRYQKDISEDRWGDREQRSYIGISQERERGTEQRSEQQVSEDRRGDKEWRTYTGTDVRHL